MMYEWMGFPYPVKGWRYQRDTMQKLHDDGRIWYPKKDDGSFDSNKRPRLKRYLLEQEGSIVTNIWTDIQLLHDVSGERLGYPTQKPLALLERIIQASSNPGDIVLDPFCGCGTAIAAAEKLGRKWVGIDITHLAISLIKYRMKDMFPDCQYAVIGEPQDLADARQLAHDDRYQFQWWALSLIEARPLGGEAGSKKGKKGSDKGIDGIIHFFDDASGKPKSVIIQVKSGHVKAGDLRDLRGVLDREDNAVIGVFITLEPSTSEMSKEAATAGTYTSELWDQKYPKLQILTIQDLLSGSEIKMPPAHGTFKQAERVKKGEGKQGRLI
jgi:site-specific DNA-methyltransferase (adenine-specific)